MNRFSSAIFFAGLLSFSAAARTVSDAVFIMPSKDVYETCEDMWFKAYVLDAATRTLSEKSNTLYLKITDPADSTVWFKQYPLYAGCTEGQVYIADDWRPGDYRVEAFTRSSLAADATVSRPRRIVVLDNLQRMDSVLEVHKTDDTSQYSASLGNMHIAIRTDSTDYHQKSRICVDFEVTDSLGRPMRAEIAVSVFDRLYHAPFAYDNIAAHYALPAIAGGDEFLPDGVAGKLSIGSKKKAKELDGKPGEQYINFYAPDSTPNFVATDVDGNFEIDRDAAAALPEYFFLKSVSGKELKPRIELRDPAAEISAATCHCATEWSHAVLTLPEETADTVPSYAGRRTYHLDDIEVTARVRYPKRDKFYGYLDSISTIYGTAWVCRHAHGDSYLNDYEQGYTHHPNGYGMDIDGPVQVLRPQKGKRYQIVKYDTSESIIGNLLDLRIVEYKGEKLTEEQLLRLNGIWKAHGYYPHRTFSVPTKDDVDSGLFDNANTLLWNPAIVTDENGRAHAEFYASDITSTFYIIVNAIDGSGGIATAAAIFNVIR